MIIIMVYAYRIAEFDHSETFRETRDTDSWDTDIRDTTNKLLLTEIAPFPIKFTHIMQELTCR